jgi:hypothetical protein
MIYILAALILVAFFFIFKWTSELDKHYKWFNSLKPGDLILVMIFSESCECYKEAMVIEEPVGKFVEARMSTDETEKCILCHKANDTCLYQVTQFHRNTVKQQNEQHEQHNRRNIHH